MFKKKKNKTGFSLIEIIVAVSILAILTVFLVPSLIHMQQNARVKQDNVKFESIATELKRASSDPEVQKEMEKFGGGLIKVVFLINRDGLIIFEDGEVIGTSNTPMKNTDLWKNIYQTIDFRYKTESKAYINNYLIFSLTPKTPTTTATCTYEITKTHPVGGTLP